ncbi:methyltransferase, FxLD system [Streptomyces sp. SID4948]|nr:methyltransferase, FxLD system [Streptomyces sp. SID4948]
MLGVRLADVSHRSFFEGQVLNVVAPDARGEAEEEVVFEGSIDCNPYAADAGLRVPVVNISAYPEHWVLGLDPGGVAEVAAKLRAQADRLDHEIRPALIAARADWAAHHQLWPRGHQAGPQELRPPQQAHPHDPQEDPRSNDVTTESPDPARVNALREGLIAELRGLNALRSQAVEDALRAVPRHLFVPEDSLEKAYAAERALVTKRDERGVALSSVSAARIQAFMLEQADIRPGMRVLEIGSGGYNASLIAELVGSSGQVTTIDIDPDVIDRARRLLPAAGYGHVNALVVDGDHGEPDHAPYDRIVVTVEAAGLAAAWVDQLTEAGRIVVPLRMRGLTRSVAFQRENGHLVGLDYEVCGFVPMRGAGARDQQLIVLHDGEDDHVGLRLEDAGRLDADKLRGAFRQPRTEAWSGVTMERGLPYDDLDLWLATTLDEYALLAATRAARDRGLVASASPMGVSTLLGEGGDSFAYLTMRPTTPEREAFEFGAVAHGPEAGKTADRLIAQFQTWDRNHRGQRAELAAYPKATPAEQLPAGRLLEAGAFRLTISWPAGR